MAQMWCISCQANRDHAYRYCQGSCGNNCYNRCSTCGRETLVNTQITSTTPVSTNDMVGIAQRSGFQGEVSVKVETGNVFSGEYKCQTLAYNTHTGNYNHSQTHGRR